MSEIKLVGPIKFITIITLDFKIFTQIILMDVNIFFRKSFCAIQRARLVDQFTLLKMSQCTMILALELAFRAVAASENSFF